ncbi:hypothetical protein A2U01_0114066, partial [Trifolium medium]|nr:hypothetical protein [Trifolium medium]
HEVESALAMQVNTHQSYYSGKGGSFNKGKGQGPSAKGQIVSARIAA